MKNVMTRTLLSIASLMLVVSMIASSGAISTAQGDTAIGADLLTYTTHSVIRVNNNAELAAEATSGSGSVDDPYVIEGYNITGSGGICIFIGNTTAHLIIRDCYLHNAEGAGDSLKLYKVTNAEVENNNCIGSNIGIHLDSSSNNTVVYNTCNQNFRCGIFLDSSNNNTISTNTCNKAAWDGIILDSSSNNMVVYNTCIWNYYCGIRIDSSSKNTVANNTCCENDVGICLENGEGNRKGSNNNRVVNNDCNWNAVVSIYLGISSNNTISNNACNLNDVGITLAGSSDNVVDNNSCNDNTQIGISLLRQSSNNTISNNTCSGNVQYGISLASSCNGSRITGNVLTNNNGTTWTYNSLHVQAYDDGTNYWNSSMYGNYWSDWTTPDTDGDGIVDSPYSINGGSNQDHYPMVFFDTAAPTVVVSPTGDGIDIDAKIVVKFSELMNVSSVTIIVSDSVGGDVVFVGNVATYTPNTLEYNREYTVTVTGKDLAGNSVAKTWTFSTMVKHGNISGRVIDKDGNALVNVMLTLSNGMTTVTNATGHFVFENVDIGNYTVSIVKDGYDTRTTNVTVVADVTDELGSIALTGAPPSTDSTTLVGVAMAAIAVIAAYLVLFYTRKRPRTP
jgi:parallel beta-helix repeat protein